MQLNARVFVSSTWLELQPERLAVEKALQRMRQIKLNGMEYFGSRDETTREVSLKEVDRSDVYVGIIGGRYGSGITEEEYRRASEKKLPRFIYFKDEQYIKPDGRDSEEASQNRLAAWKTELRQAHALGTGPFTSPDDLAARVTADLSNWLLERYGAQLYLEGVSSLPYASAGRIENFLGEYLGTAKTPVPFGGREKDLKALDTWLENPGAPPYFMMAAPAGRGKSALLVQWTRQVLARPNIALVFVPISIRFGTNLSSVTFAALAARLARLHGEKIPDTPSISVETWRGLVTEYLRRPLPSGETLLVVLDGLDEAADWEIGPDLFPLPPPDHVRVVVSARYRAGDEDARDWLRRLGWEPQDLARSYDLDRLTKEGVARVLESMGFPLAQLGAQIDIVAELFRLSEGDPLLLRLYVNDLWTHREMVGSLKPEDLRRLQPGLKGYFDRWWAEQRTLWGKDRPLKEQNVQTVLNVLACALGPLDQEALLRLTHLSSTWDLVEALKPLDRFIVGDGKVQGYVFSHPRLGNYFEQKLSSAEQDKWEKEFLTWGRDTVQALEQGTLAPVKAPAYIVQYYGAHLERAHVAAETLLTLVSHGWSRAWEALEGSYAGFLNDVERAWKAAERENEQAIAKGDVAPRIGDEIRCALVQASINSLAANVSLELLVELVKEKVWTFSQGLAYARQIPTPFIRARALMHLATGFTFTEDLREATFNETIEAARHIDDIRQRAEVVTTLAPHLSEGGRTNALHELLGAARQLKDRWKSTAVLTIVAPHLPDKDRNIILHEALGSVRYLEPSPDRTAVLKSLAFHLPQEVFEIACLLEDRRERADVLEALAPHLPQEVLGMAQQLEDNGTRTAIVHFSYPRELFGPKALEPTWDCAAVLRALAPHLPQEVLGVAQHLKDQGQHARVLLALLHHLSEENRKPVLQEAFEAIRQVGIDRERAYLLVALVPHLPLEDRAIVLQEALEVARQLKPIQSPEAVLVALAPHLPQEVFEVAQFEENRERTDVLVALAPHLPQKVLGVARHLENSVARAEILGEVARHLPEKDRKPLLQEVFQAARHLGDIRAHADVLRAAAPHLPEMDRKAVLQDVLQVARQLEDNEARATVLLSVAPNLSEKDRKAVLQDVLQVARQLEDNEARVTVLVSVAPNLSEKDRKAVLQEALETVPQMENDYGRKQVLCALAPHLPKDVLQVAQQLKDNRAHADVLRAVAFHLPEKNPQAVLQELLQAARQLADSGARAEMLGEVAPRLPKKDRKAVLQEALETVPQMENDYGRKQVLCALAPHLPKDVLQVAQQLKDNRAHADVLRAVAFHLPEKNPQAVLQELLQAARQLADSGARAGVLCALAPHLSKKDGTGVLLEAFQTARHLENSVARAEILGEIAHHLPETNCKPVLQEALEAVRQVEDDGKRALALLTLAPHLPKDVLQVVRHMEDGINRNEVLKGLAPHLPKDVLQDARQLEDSGARAEMLCALAPHLTEKDRKAVLQEAFEALPQVKDNDLRSVMDELAPNLEAISGVILYPVWRRTLRHLSTRPRRNLMEQLCPLMPMIRELGRERALIEMIRAVRHVTTWWS